MSPSLGIREEEEENKIDQCSTSLCIQKESRSESPDAPLSASPVQEGPHKRFLPSHSCTRAACTACLQRQLCAFALAPTGAAIREGAD
eukprot:5096550-Prymnesium_polylepis.1